MIRTGLTTLLGPYLPVVEIVAVLGAAWYGYEHVKAIGYRQAMTEVARLQALADKAKDREIEDAKHSRDAELADLARLTADLMRRDRDVRVSVPPAQQPPAEAGAATGTPVVHAVPAGGAGCEKRDGAEERPNIFPMLRSIAVAADAVSAADREQVKVR